MTTSVDSIKLSAALTALRLECEGKSGVALSDLLVAAKHVAAVLDAPPEMLKAALDALVLAIEDVEGS